MEVVLCLTLSLGSSSCLHCPAYWPGLLVTIVIVFVISGISLIALLLVLNLTVAIGTLNAVIFYANIIAANRNTLLSTSDITFASVVISWLNFDLGFDVCFYDGMDMNIKTLLQLAFPLYIICLVIVIIKLSYHCEAFGRLIGRRDPVATLATLVLLSYAKLLQTIITTFSSAILNYPDSSKTRVWLPDATIVYFSSKHAVLFFVAILIILASLLYTLLLFSWQWLVCCPRRRMKWIRNQKVHCFLETYYYVPFSPKHRYWTGLLLFVRVSVYLVSAFNISGNPELPLLYTVLIVCFLLLYMAMFGVRIYRRLFLNVMETFTYFNIIAVSLLTWYTIDLNSTNQSVITNTSVGITFVQIMLVASYHTYRYMNSKIYFSIHGSVLCKRLNEMLRRRKLQDNHKSQPHDDLFHTTDYRLSIRDSGVRQDPSKPTTSVVDLPNLHRETKNDVSKENESDKDQQCNRDIKSYKNISLAGKEYGTAHLLQTSKRQANVEDNAIIAEEHDTESPQDNNLGPEQDSPPLFTSHPKNVHSSQIINVEAEI